MRRAAVRGCMLITAFVWSASARAETIALVDEGGVYVLPVEIGNTLSLKFVLDSGASDVTLPKDVVQTLMRLGAIQRGDFIGTQTYTLADGSRRRSSRFILHELKVGNSVVRDVTASVAPADGALLLGQSFLSKLPRWSIDNNRHTLILGEEAAAGPPPPQPSRPLKAQAQTAERTFVEARAAYAQGDYATTLRLSRPLAEQGDAMSQLGLGFLYFSGKGVGRDYVEAAKWYRRAADQGNGSGQESLGRMYASGLGVRQDYVTAYQWFNLAAANGDGAAMASRDEIATRMTPAQIAEAQKLSREWAPKAE